MKRIITTLAALICMTGTAQAAEPSGSFCQEGRCFDTATATYHFSETWEKGEIGFIHTGTGNVYLYKPSVCVYVYQSKQAWLDHGAPKLNNTCSKASMTFVADYFHRYPFPVLPDQDYRNLSPFKPDDTLTVVRYFHQGQQAIDRTDAYVDKATPSRPIGSPLRKYCAYYVADSLVDKSGKQWLRNDVPQDIVDACVAAGLAGGRIEDMPEADNPLPDASKPKPPAKKPAGVVVPASAAKCGKVGKVDVRSTRVKCAFAKNVIARYAKTLKSPSGWTCTATISDAGRRARCQAKSKGKAALPTAVYGLWKR